MTAAAPGDHAAFISACHRGPQGPLPYRLLLPRSYDPARSYPLLTVLHGRGERGSDNVCQLANGVDRFLLGFARFAECIAIAPQCPDDDFWVPTDFSAPAHRMAPRMSRPLAAAVDLQDEIIRSHRIDTKRLWITGLSMGGFATWELLARFPGRFAKALPICGGADLSTLPTVLSTPVRTVHGGEDQVVLTRRSRDIAAEAERLGHPIPYTEYPGVRHNAWDSAWADDELWEWMTA
jgi:predicted peptidase